MPSAAERTIPARNGSMTMEAMTLVGAGNGAGTAEDGSDAGDGASVDDADFFFQVVGA